MALKSDQNKSNENVYNPRLSGYLLVLLTSLVGFSSISNIDRDSGRFDGIWGLCLSFPSLVFTFVLLIILLDRTQLCKSKCNYTKACDGKFEGSMLLFLTVWSIVGTGYITQSNGIAYEAMNVYFSTWLQLFSCIYVLNQWSASKDILTIAELTGVSATLKSWYVLLIASAVVFGSGVDIFSDLDDDSDKGDAALAVAFGVSSSLVSFVFILVHYKFFQCCSEGGWTEFVFACTLVLLWIVGVSVLTRDDGIAATIVGRGCTSSYFDSREELKAANCTITLYEDDGMPTTLSCYQGTTDYVPGSNLYFGTWTCFLSSINLTFRWKAQQALQFAQTQSKRRAAKAAKAAQQEGAGGTSKDVDDGDDDLDDFEDADGF